MALNEQSDQRRRRRRSRKMLLWFAMASIMMMFAGFTSAYVVSQSRKDWIDNLGLPPIFIWSTVAIFLSSIALAFVKKSILDHRRSRASLLLIIGFVLGIAFSTMQIIGFGDIVANGYYPAGSSSTINVSFYYVIIFMHLLHLLAGLIVLIVVIYNHFKERYKEGQTLGLELGVTFWHFLDFVWLYLFFFIYFFG